MFGFFCRHSNTSGHVPRFVASKPDQSAAPGVSPHSDNPGRAARESAERMGALAEKQKTARVKFYSNNNDLHKEDEVNLSLLKFLNPRN